MSAGAVHAQDPAALPLSQRIDAAIAAGGPAVEVCNDADFVRRVYLDLVGMVPSVREMRAFLDDAAPDKRAKLIDALLADPRFARRMAQVFDVTLMERRDGKHVKSPEWEQYLYESFVQRKPLDQLCREILSADGVDPAQRAPARFFLDRDADPNVLTRDIGRIFFGRDLQCAQCHDHPLISDYYQTEYYGILAFVQRSYLFEDKANKRHVLAEKAEGEAKFQSVFDATSKGTMTPLLPGGALLAEPTFAGGDAYRVSRDKDVRPVPKFSRRAQLATAATAGTNGAFARNFANRLWALLMKRGLVEPLDLHHVDNPPSHPQLLTDLADTFVAQQFDVAALLRELALSRVYQRPLELPGDWTARVQHSAAQVAPLEAEQARLLAALAPLETQLTALEAPRKELLAATEPLLAAVEKSRAALQAVEKPAAAAQQALAESKAQMAARDDVAKTVAATAAQTSLVLTKLPNDAELKAAAEKFGVRAKQLAAEVEALLRTVSEREAAVNQATAALATARQQVDALRVQAGEGLARVNVAHAEYERVLSAVRAEQLSLAHAKAQLEQTRAIAAVGAKITAPAAAEQQLAQLKTALETSRLSLEKATAALPAAQAAQTAAEKAAQDAAALFTAARQQTQEKQTQVTALGEAATKAEEAKAKLPGDAEVAAAAQLFAQKQQQLTAELSELQKQRAVLEQAAQTAAAALVAATQQTTALSAEMTTAQQQMAALTLQVEAAAKTLAEAQTAAASAEAELVDVWTRQFVVGAMQPLSPEQLAWSLLQVTGQIDRQLAAATAELEKNEPLDDAAQADPVRVAARRRAIHDLVYQRLSGNSNQFVRLFAAAPGQPQDQFFATVDQALFFANGGVVQNWIAGGGGGDLLPRLTQAADPKAVALELYISVLARKPLPAETAQITQYLSDRTDDRAAALQELAWGLITSAEFRFNH